MRAPKANPLVESSYLPSTDGTPANRPMGVADMSTDARSYFHDRVNYTWRPYLSKSEVLAYLNTAGLRRGNFPIYIEETPGVIEEYEFKDCVADDCLRLKLENVARLDLANVFLDDQTAPTFRSEDAYFFNTGGMTHIGNTVGDQPIAFENFSLATLPGVALYKYVSEFTGTVIIDTLAGFANRGVMVLPSGQLAELGFDPEPVQNSPNYITSGVVQKAVVDLMTLKTAQYVEAEKTFAVPFGTSGVKAVGNMPAYSPGPGSGSSASGNIMRGANLAFLVAFSSGSSPGAAGTVIGTITRLGTSAGAFVSWGARTAATAGMPFYFETAAGTILIKAGMALPETTSYMMDITVIDY